MVCVPEIAVSAVMPQHITWATPEHDPSWSAEDWTEKASCQTFGQASFAPEAGPPTTLPAEEAACQRTPPTAAAFQHMPPTATQKVLMKIRKKLREITKIEDMVAAGVEVDPLQRRKLSQKEAVMVQLEQAARAIAEEEARVTTEQWRQQLQQQQQQQQMLQHEQLLLEQQQQQHQEHQHQLFQQVAPEVCQSPNIAAYSWLPGTQVQVIGGMAPTCDEHGQQVQQLQWLQACPMPVEQPAVVEHLQVPLQVFPACKEPNVSSQEGAVHHDVHQHHAEDVRRAVPKDMHEDMVVAAIPAPSCGGVDMLMESLSGDSEAKTHALASLRGSVAFHAFESQGCRVVQLAFQVADTRVAAELLSELKGSVRAATRSRPVRCC